MIKAVLFDMDGVLFESMSSHAQAWHETMTKQGVDCTPEEFYLHEGRTGFSTIDILFNRSFGRDATQEEKENIYAIKSARFTELESSNPMEGALAVLNKVKEHHLQHLIVTGSGQASLFNKIDHYFPGFFDKSKMVTAYDVKIGKPHPEPYLMGLEKAQVKPEEAIVVENAPLGVESGRAAGIYTVAVNTGPLPDKVLIEAGANSIYPSMQALADNFDTLIEHLDQLKMES